MLIPTYRKRLYQQEPDEPNNGGSGLELLIQLIIIGILFLILKYCN